VNDEHVGTFIKAIYRANFYTIGVLALDAIFSNDECHKTSSTILKPDSLADAT
jgi:hypothetical protein|tara:strand:+ start:267 stop:425 length:159 start_codon:yes stop_codon:yes gene_type:complete